MRNFNVKNIFVNLLVLITMTVLFTGCGNNDLRGYSFGHINKTYAQKLMNCKHYKAPVYVHAPLIVPVDKYQSEIVGVKNNRCVLRTYRADGFSPKYNIQDEYILPLEFTKDLSILLQEAFKEPEFHETSAIFKGKAFCNKYRRMYCSDSNTFDYIMYQVEEYMREISKY